MSASATTMSLVIYIDEQLMHPDPITGLPKVGNLAFARKVGGVANVIFQSKTTADFGIKNTFAWKQAYKIGASSTPPQPSAFIQADAGKKPIGANFMCNWLPDPSKPALQYMPTAVPVDDGWFTKFSNKQGMFGTKGQPDKWYNSIWCCTSGDNYACIYSDPSAIPGMDYRGYQVENNYQVSWESALYTPGIFAGSWSIPHDFSIENSNDPAKNIKYLSWGYPIQPNKPPTWFNYGTQDPGAHDPSKAILSDPTTSGGSQDPPFTPQRLGFRLDWTGPYFSEATKHANARVLFEYVSRSTNGWLNLTDVYLGPYLSARANLRQDTTFGDYIPGETQEEKVRFFLRGIVSNISPRIAPNLIDWNYDNVYDVTVNTNSQGVGNFLRLFWTGLQNGTAAASTSLNWLKPYFKSTLENKYGGNIGIKYESITEVGQDKTKATTKLEITNLPNGQLDAALAALKDIVDKERANPVPIQPDNVQIQKDNGSAIYFEASQERLLIEFAPQPTVQATEERYQSMGHVPSAYTGNGYTGGFVTESSDDLFQLQQGVQAQNTYGRLPVKAAA